MDLVDQRRSELEDFISEGRKALVNFLEFIGIPSPSLALVDAEPFMKYVSDWLSREDFAALKQDDLRWLTTQIANVSAYYFITKHNGKWLVNDIKGSEFYARYVVGAFPGSKAMTAMVDPFSLSQNYMQTPPGRDLVAIVKEAEKQLVQLIQLGQN